MRVNLGQLLLTRGVNDKVADDENFAKEITTAIQRYLRHDWGDLEDCDKQQNDDAVKNGEDRILAVYATSLGKVYVITEWERSATTILFASEY